MKREIFLKLEELGQQTAQDLGLELVELNQKKDKDGLHIEAIIYTPKGIGIDQCAEFSRSFDKKVESIDLGPSPYFIEVASPGLDRPIKSDGDLRRNKGNKVEVKLYQKLDGKKEFVGQLLDYKEDSVDIDIDGTIQTIPRDHISLMRQSIEF